VPASANARSGLDGHRSLERLAKPGAELARFSTAPESLNALVQRQRIAQMERELLLFCRSDVTSRNIRIPLGLGRFAGRGGGSRGAASALSRLGLARNGVTAKTPRRPLAVEHATASHSATVFFVLALLVIAAYGRSLDNGFVFDDAVLMERDVRLAKPVQWEKIFTKPLWMVPDGKGAEAIEQQYRPLQLVPLAASKAWFHGSALPCHLINLSLHFLNSLLVYGLMRRLWVAPVPALMLAALFAVHPALSESVLWVSGVSGLGAAMATLGLVLLHARKGPTPMGSVLIAFLYLLAMGFEEAAILAPLFLIAFDVIARRHLEERSRAVPWADYGLLFPALSVYLTLRQHALGSIWPSMSVSGLTWSELGVNAIALLPKYAATYLRSFDLSIYHDFVTAGGVGDPRFQTGALLAIAAALVFLGTVGQRPAAAFGVAWAAIAAAPFLVVRWPWLNVFAERYTYLPAVGVVLACGGLLQLTMEPARWERWTRTLAGVAVAILIPLLAWVGYERTSDWKSEHTVAASSTLPSGAESESQKGIRLQIEMLAKNPNAPQAWHNLGLLYLAADRPRDAMGAFREAERRDPGRAPTLLNLGYAYDRSGQRELAIETYFRMLELHPKAVDARFNLAVIAFEAGQIANAREILSELLAITPKDAPAQTLKAKLDAIGSTPLMSAQPSSATHRRCQEATRIAAAGKPLDAIAKLRAAAWLDERSSLPHHYLANLLYRSGRIDQALAHQRKAVALAPDNTIYRDNLAALERARRGELANLDGTFPLTD
jgi:tetratricopeptide (TPR) repeat protein